MTNMTRIVDGKRVITLDEYTLLQAQVANLERDKVELQETIDELTEQISRDEGIAQ